MRPAWESSVTAGLTLTRGNSDTLLFTAGVLTDKKTPDNEFKLGADAAYGENNGVKNVDTEHVFGQYNDLFTDRFYGYARAEGLHDGLPICNTASPSVPVSAIISSRKRTPPSRVNSVPAMSTSASAMWTTTTPPSGWPNGLNTSSRIRRAGLGKRRNSAADQQV